MRRLCIGSLPAALVAILVLKSAGELDARWLHGIRLMIGVSVLLTVLSLLFRKQMLAWLERNPRYQLEGRRQVVATVVVGAVIGVLVTGVVDWRRRGWRHADPAAVPPYEAGRGGRHRYRLRRASTAVAELGHVRLGTVDWNLLLALLVGSIPGIWLGAQLSRALPERLVRAALATTLTLVAIKLVSEHSTNTERTHTMYQYDQYDQRIVQERVAQFRDQVRRRLADELTEEEFLPLRLQNGLYMQRHAYMLRVAIPYGLLASKQMRMLAHIARKYDRGYGHFSTRQNIQYNWMDLERVPDVLADLASVEMHGIQTSGNCVRNITTDHFAGVTRTRPWTRACWPNCCASGAPSSPNSPSCRASSRSPSRPPPTTAPWCRCTTSASTPTRTPLARRACASWPVAACEPHADPGHDHQGRPAVAAHADLRGVRDPRVQPLRPPRQQVQGAHRRSS